MIETKPPYRALAAGDLSYANSYRKPAEDGSNVQHLVIGQLPPNCQVIPMEQRDLVRHTMETEEIKVIFAQENSDLEVPIDTINLDHVNFQNTDSEQGETFGAKIERIFKTLSARLSLPREAFAFSVTGQLVVLVPYRIKNNE